MLGGPPEAVCPVITRSSWSLGGEPSTAVLTLRVPYCAELGLRTQDSTWAGFAVDRTFLPPPTKAVATVYLYDPQCSRFDVETVLQHLEGRVV